MPTSGTYVWDPLVRIFHWSLVVFFSIAYFTEDDFMSVHEFAGYAVLGLIGFRVVWGLIGTRYARFTNFVYRPTTIVAYLKDFIALRPKHYLGHNPAGGLMVIILLLMLMLTALTGIQAEEAEYSQVNNTISLISPAHADDDEHERRAGEGNEFWEDIHEALANLSVLLIVLHVAGVFASSIVHNENLVRAMITGYKQDQE